VFWPECLLRPCSQFLILNVSPEGVLCEAPPRGLFHRAVSLIQPAYASILVAHVVAAMTSHGFVLTVYGPALVAHKPIPGHRRSAAIPEPATPRTRRCMPVILIERAVLMGRPATPSGLVRRPQEMHTFTTVKRMASPLPTAKCSSVSDHDDPVER
jgi:hypothetical protein